MSLLYAKTHYIVNIQSKWKNTVLVCSYTVIRPKHSLVGHLLSVPAEGAVECHRLFAAQSFSETTVELTEAPQTRDKLPAADREDIEKVREQQKEERERKWTQRKINSIRWCAQRGKIKKNLWNKDTGIYGKIEGLGEKKREKSDK